MNRRIFFKISIKKIISKIKDKEQAIKTKKANLKKKHGEKTKYNPINKCIKNQLNKGNQNRN